MPSFPAFVKTTLQRIKRLIKKYPYLTSLLVATAAILIAFTISRRLPKKKLQTLMLSDFLDAVNNNLVQEVVVKTPQTLVFKTMIGSFLTDTSLMSKEQLFNIIASKPIKLSSSSSYTKNSGDLLDAVFGTSIFLVSMGLSILIFLKTRTQQKHNFNQENESSIRFDDIYGLEKPKQILQETIDFLANPKRYQDIGCRLRKGIIFYGPPGTGKTMLAKAMATESNSKFISCSAAQFCQMYVGVGPKRIRKLFQAAKKYKSSIIFIDQIDAIGRRKDQRQSDTQRNNTLNQLLVQMDGFISNSRVVVIAATNKIQMIDAALLRSGRFDLKIQIPLPNEKERKGILDLHLAKKSAYVPEQLIKEIALKSEGFCGADLQNLTNQAAYKALRKKKNQISQYELQEAFQQMTFVSSKSRKL